MVDRWDGETIILGDFNEVRSESERFGTLFNPQGANAFNSFISSTGLIDLPLGGYSFTWAYKSTAKISKLDRFLISKGIMISFPHLSALCLEKHLSDHRPILTRDMILDYGPTLFCVFHSWFKMEGFKKIVKETWTEVAEIAQKAKIRWAIEGDEKSRYFHDILNSKHSQLAIRGILNDGDYIDDPCMVKNNFLEYFSNRFSKPDSSWLKLDFIFPNQLTSMQSEDLERPVTYDEIKAAIWECGTNKSLEVDGVVTAARHIECEGNSTATENSQV
ncbi:RNA-directed DNA polymerase, eukaryota [Tanacetum coccineum]